MCLWCAALAMAGVLALTPLLRRLALQIGLVDQAGEDPLKIHKKAVPLSGGSVLVPVFVFMLLICGPQSGARDWLWPVINAGVMIFILGLADDLRPLKPQIRIIVHFLAGSVIFFSSIRPEMPFPAAVTALITMFYIAGAINAFNVIDGMDGLCAGITLFSCLGFLILGIAQQNPPLYMCAALLGASVLGLLPYNMYPAKIFLGDSGSGFLGCLCGIMAVMAIGERFSFSRFAATILILGVPAADMTAAIIRRAFKHRPLFQGDRDHLYDLLLKKGMTQPQVWGIIFFMQGILVLAGLWINRS